jgi:hypothetical protein
LLHLTTNDEVKRISMGLLKVLTIDRQSQNSHIANDPMRSETRKYKEELGAYHNEAMRRSNQIGTGVQGGCPERGKEDAGSPKTEKKHRRGLGTAWKLY